MSDGTRTRDRLDHNQELYLLSYAHHAAALVGATLAMLAAEGDAACGAAAGGAGAVHDDLEREVGGAGA